MATIHCDGTLIQKPLAAFRATHPNLAFDDLNENAFAQYQDASERPADPDWSRTPAPGNRDAPNRGEWAYPMPIIDFTWHHVIPWNMLCGTWGALAREKQWQNLHRLMNILDISSPATKIKHMKASQLNDTEIDEIHHHLCWRAWNVVEGPLNTHRVDDPDEGFDEFKYGLPDNARERMKDLKDLYEVMNTFVTASRRRRADAWLKRRDEKDPALTDAGMLTDMLGARMYHHRQAKLIMFRLEMWEMVEPGARGGGYSWAVKPRWRRASKERSPKAIADAIELLRLRFI